MVWNNEHHWLLVASWLRTDLKVADVVPGDHKLNHFSRNHMGTIIVQKKLQTEYRLHYMFIIIFFFNCAIYI